MLNDFLQSAIDSWTAQSPSLYKYFDNTRFARPYIELANHAIKSPIFWAAHAEDFIDGLVFLKFGFARDNKEYLEEAGKCLRPVKEAIIERLKSEAFQETLISRTVTGEERLPIEVPEIYITVKELLLLNKRLNWFILEDNDVSKLKQELLKDKIESWGLTEDSNDDFLPMLKIYHPGIFNLNGYLVFDYLMKNQKRSGRGVVTDINYFYLRMVTDRFIHAKEEEFKKWFGKEYPDFPVLDRFHKMERIKAASQRIDRYKSALAYIKSNKL